MEGWREWRGGVRVEGSGRGGNEVQLFDGVTKGQSISTLCKQNKQMFESGTQVRHGEGWEREREEEVEGEEGGEKRLMCYSIQHA